MPALSTVPVRRRSTRRCIGRPTRGVMLFELLIGIGAIVAVIVVMVVLVVMVDLLVGMRGLNAPMHCTALLREVPQIRMTLAGFSSGRTSVKTLTTEKAVKMGAFPGWTASAPIASRRQTSSAARPSPAA